MQEGLTDDEYSMLYVVIQVQCTVEVLVGKCAWRTSTERARQAFNSLRDKGLIYPVDGGYYDTDVTKEQLDNR